VIAAGIQDVNCWSRWISNRCGFIMLVGERPGWPDVDAGSPRSTVAGRMSIRRRLRSLASYWQYGGPCGAAARPRNRARCWNHSAFLIDRRGFSPVANNNRIRAPGQRQAVQGVVEAPCRSAQRG